MITRITYEGNRISTSFDLIKKTIEEKNTLLEQKKDSLMKASNEFMSSRLYFDPNFSSNN